MSMAPRTLRIVLGPGAGRLDKALAEASDLSRSRIAALIAEGAVSQAGRVETSPKAKAAPGTWEVALPEAAPSDLSPEDIPLAVAYEDAHLAIVDKPAGMVVHPAPGSPAGTLVNALMHRYGADLPSVGGVARPGIVHRIDKDTSGLVVVARTDLAMTALSAAFAAHDVDREYRAFCHGVPDPGDPRLMGTRGVARDGAWIRVETRLDRHRTDRQRQAVFFERGRHALTRVRLVRAFEGAAEIACRLETGRTHQIRVHMAHAGHALIGDPDYGGRRRLPRGAPGAEAAAAFGRQALHAAVLGFAHPATGEPVRCESALPPDMAALGAALEG